jgi:CheY-like chemotaxis protein
MPDAGTKDIIIADNDYIIRDILRSVLAAQGLNVLSASDGYEAIGYAAHTSASLFILDYKMPRLDGVSACRTLRCLPEYAETPILILTAFDDDDTRMIAREAGVTAFLGKPFKPVDLLRVVGDLLGTPNIGCETAAQPVLVWKRQAEPLPLFGEPAKLAEGRRLLKICRG